eukprot:3753191-Prymnesium_polylepis.1
MASQGAPGGAIAAAVERLATILNAFPFNSTLGEQLGEWRGYVRKLLLGTLSSAAPPTRADVRRKLQHAGRDTPHERFAGLATDRRAARQAGRRRCLWRRARRHAESVGLSCAHRRACVAAAATPSPAAPSECPQPSLP